MTVTPSPYAGGTYTVEEVGRREDSDGNVFVSYRVHYKCNPGWYLARVNYELYRSDTGKVEEGKFTISGYLSGKTREVEEVFYVDYLGGGPVDVTYSIELVFERRQIHFAVSLNDSSAHVSCEGAAASLNGVALEESQGDAEAYKPVELDAIVGGTYSVLTAKRTTDDQQRPCKAARIVMENESSAVIASADGNHLSFYLTEDMLPPEGVGCWYTRMYCKIYYELIKTGQILHGSNGRILRGVSGHILRDE